MNHQTSALPTPRLVLRLGGLGNRKFGTDNGIAGKPSTLQTAAKHACEEAFTEIVKALTTLYAEDQSPENIFPPMEDEARYWLASRWGLFFGGADRWRRLERAGCRAPVFSRELPKLTVLTGDAKGGDEIIWKAAAGLHGVEVEHLCIAPKAPGSPTDGLNVGDMPDSSEENPALPLSRHDAHQRAEAARQRAYGFRAQSEALRHHSDILLAIWDPDAEGKAGGTSETVLRALKEGVPVLAIRLTGAGHTTTTLLKAADDLSQPPRDDWRPALHKIIGDLLRFPVEDWRSEKKAPSNYHDAVAEDEALDDEDETEKSYHPRIAYAAFLEGKSLPTIWVGRLWPAFNRAIKTTSRVGRYWRGISIPFTWLFLPYPGERSAKKGEGAPGSYEFHYRHSRNRASDMATVFGEAHRGGIITSYLLAAIAVILALAGATGFAFKLPIGFLISAAFVELLIIILLYALYRTSKHEDWREAYTDSRILAEALRAMEYIGPLGIHTPLPQLPAYADGGKHHARATRWPIWYFRTLVRQAPLRVDDPKIRDLEARRHYLLEEWIGSRGGGSANSQVSHHEANVPIQRRIEQLIENQTAMWFWTVVVAVCIHLGFIFFHKFYRHYCESHDIAVRSVEFALLFFCVGGPALISAFHGLLSQIEATRLRRRSRGMVRLLDRHYHEMKKLDLATHPTYAEAHWGLCVESLSVASLMVNEVADWSLIYKDIPLH